MKQFLLFVLAWLLPGLSLQASPKFDANAKYRFVSKQKGTGALVLGSNHNSTAYLYYAADGEDADDAWWTIEEEGNGYTIRNVQSGTYITYRAERIDGVAKGLVLAEASQGEESEWNFTLKGEADHAYVIANVKNTNQWWNLRNDGTNLLGTYDRNTASDNELFYIYDENGNQVTENGTIKPGGGESGGGESGGDVRDDFEAAKGITQSGEYWELQGISQPVVYTTDTTNPVLYSIANHRSGKYVNATGGYLYQTDDATAHTHFYFVKKDNDQVQIFTSEGQYVSTSYDHSANDHVAVGEGTPSGNLWKLEWSNLSTSGYGICRTDNLDNNGSEGGNGGWGGWGGWEWGDTQTYTYWNDYSKSYIGLYSLDTGSTFVFTSSDQRHIDLLKRSGITFSGSRPDVGTVALHTALDSLQIGGKEVVYDRKALIYYHPLPQSLMDGGDYTTSIHFVPKAKYDTLQLVIDGEAVAGRTDSVTLREVTCDRTYKLQLVDSLGTSHAEADLQFTFLPLVELTMPDCNGSIYTEGSIRVTDIEAEGYDSVFVAAYRYRGATAQGYSKKSYAVKLRDAQGESVDRSFFGLRSDNNWILDAMAVDPACMRNRVATDIWNDFSAAPYYKDREKKALTGTRGRFVEVFLNGSYHGIYCMTEKLDRKQLKLKKFKAAAESKSGEDEVHGLLYKSSQWSYEVFMGHNSDSHYFPETEPRSFSNTLGQETWAQFELKYPDYAEEAVEWTPLWNAVNFVATSSQDDFDAHVADYFDMPVVKDYYLFLDLLLATDNHGKNMFYSVYDRKGEEGDRLSLTPWDLDGTLGARWDGSTRYTSDATQDFDNFLWNYEHGELTLYYKLRQSGTLKWEDQLAERYAEVRPAHFRADILQKRFSDYGRLFTASHADEREQERWGSTSVNHSDIKDAVDYCTRWIAERVGALDEKYGYDPSLESINEARSASYFAAEGGTGCVVVNAGSACRVKVYGLSGMLVRTAQVPEGQTVIQGFTPGVYVVNGVKVVVK